MSLKDQFEALAKKSPEEIEEIVKKADTQKGLTNLGRSMTSIIFDNLKKRRFGPIEQVPMTRCPSCSCEYYDFHPNNGCQLGIVQNVNES
jgi:hypothetical protein